jgi:orotate phosphoribosyltransferase
MQTYQKEFIDFVLGCEVLRFGDFTLKSGRQSPYFFNAGLFNTGARLGRLGEFYAQTLTSGGIRADVLYGPAYKGIPLVAATAIALARASGEEIPYAFNRKEAKDHGEGGTLVGAPLQGDVLIVDDVITAGTSVRESIEIIRGAGARPCGVLIALDREELGPSGKSAVQEVQDSLGIPVHAIVGFRHLIDYLRGLGRAGELAALEAYRSRYGTA